MPEARKNASIRVANPDPCQTLKAELTGCKGYLKVGKVVAPPHAVSGDCGVVFILMLFLQLRPPAGRPETQDVTAVVASTLLCRAAVAHPAF